jgi:hypothetical protein
MSDAPLQTLLVDALGERRCPLCTVLDSMVFNELCRLQREAVVDPETHADVVGRGGYCADHFWFLDALASPQTNAELLAPLIERLTALLTEVARAVSANPSLLRQGAGGLAVRVGVPASCRVCESVRVWREAAMLAMLALITDPRHQERYARSCGLCVPHLTEALAVCRDHAIAEFLLRAAAEQSQRLAVELRECVRKRMERDRRWGPEQDAPQRGIEKLVGAKRRRDRSR